MSNTGTLKIAYFGLPLGALTLAAAGFAPCVICLGHPDAKGARRVRRKLSARALILGRPDLNDSGVQRTLSSAMPDLILSWFWPKQIPGSVLALAPRGAFGTHPSLLPLWRGPDPYFWAIYAGDLETGVSLHRLEAAYDTGPIVAQRRVSIAPDDDAWSLARKLDRPALALLVECATRLAAGEALPGAAQDDEQACEAPEPDVQSLAIVWQRPVAAILRLIRAAAPYPGATAQLGEHEVEIVRARRFRPTLPRALEPADAVLSSEGVVIAARDAGVVLERVRIESGEELTGEEIARLFDGSLARV